MATDRRELRELTIFMANQRARFRDRLNTLPRRIARRQTQCYSGPMNAYEEISAAFDADRVLMGGAIPKSDLEIRK